MTGRQLMMISIASSTWDPDAEWDGVVAEMGGLGDYPGVVRSDDGGYIQALGTGVLVARFLPSLTENTSCRKAG